MGRHKLSPEKKRVLIGASIEKRIVDAIGLLQCKEIAEVAVNNKYRKTLKTVEVVKNCEIQNKQNEN